MPFELQVLIPVQLLLELEPNLLVQNSMTELDFKLSRMEQPYIPLGNMFASLINPSKVLKVNPYGRVYKKKFGKF